MDDKLTPDAGAGLDPSAIYAALVNRRIAFDQLMWQVPTLSVTAQAFLVTVGVSSNLSTVVRALALVLALMAGALAMQLMAKQRFHEQVDTAYLQQLEHQANGRLVEGFAPHDAALKTNPATGRTKASTLGVTPSRWVRLSSYRTWMWGLRCFLLLTSAMLLWVLLSG
jgi:hypothetical protein